MSPSKQSLSRQLPAALMMVALLALVGAEYHRYTVTSRAKERELAARRMQQEVADLRQREQKLQPDLALMARLDQTLLDPKQANLHQQILQQVLNNQGEAKAELQGVTIGNQGFLMGANRHGLTVQLKGQDQALIAFLQAVETGPAAARVTTLNIHGEGQNGTEPAGTGTVSIEYYSRAK